MASYTVKFLESFYNKDKQLSVVKRLEYVVLRT